MPSRKKSSTDDSTHEFKFKKDEKVLVLPTQHADDIYEAKILDRKLDKTKIAQYKIHYKGWNKRWDEWVDSRRLLKINPSNLQIMNEKKAQSQLKQQHLQQLQQQHQKQQEIEEEEEEHDDDDDDDDNNDNTEKSLSPSNSDNNNNKKRKIRSPKNSNNNKRRRLNKKGGGGGGGENNKNNKKDREREREKEKEHDHHHHDHDHNINRRDIRNNKESSNGNGRNGNVENNYSETCPLEIKLPTQLKRKLIRDWENITKKGQLIDLPRRNGVRITDILCDFESFAIKQGQDKNIVLEISRGIKDYFNQALQVTLLYKLERNQYHQIVNKYKHLSMDQIYGVEHLCRLFVKLPQLLSPNDLDIDTRQILKQQIEYIIQFVIQNDNKYFNTNYINS